MNHRKVLGASASPGTTSHFDLHAAFSSHRLNDLLELRKLRKAREGIDVAKLNKGDVRKKKKRARDEGEQGGLKKGMHEDDEE